MFKGDHMDTHREIVGSCFFATSVKDLDFGIGYSSTVLAIGIRLVLTIAIAASGSSSHDDKKEGKEVNKAMK